MKKNTARSLSASPLVSCIIEAAQEKLAERIVSLDLTGRATAADFFVVCQSDTTVQNRAIADAILDRCAEHDTHPWHCEGREDGRWILIDFTDVVVHIMLPDLRRYYGLESLWSEGKKTQEH